MHGTPNRLLIAYCVDLRDGHNRLGRAPGKAAEHVEALYQANLAGEPCATYKRLFEPRQGAWVYFDVINSLRAGESFAALNGPADSIVRSCVILLRMTYISLAISLATRHGRMVDHGRYAH